jgi:hypothetical protein
VINRPTIASALVALALAVPANAQGKSQSHKGSAPPSQSELPSSTVIGAAATPFSWLDDASVMEPGSAALALSVVRWVGTDLAETSAPVIDIGLGLTRRLQLSANIPRIVAGDDPAAGMGTSYLGMKIGVVNDRPRGVKVAVTPTLEILGSGLAAALDPGTSRIQWGLPISVEIDHGAGRAYAGSGYFSRGVWYAGAGVGVQPAARVAVAASFTRSWTRAATPDVPIGVRDRNELSGSAFYSITPNVGVFGSLGRTIATTDANAAGATFAAGISLSAAASPTSHK